MAFTNIDSILEAHPKTYVHASNIKAKQRKTNLSSIQKTALEKIEPEYVAYINAISTIQSYERNAIARRVELLNGYYDFIRNNGLDNVFTSQSKFRSTILEEFLVILFDGLLQQVRDRIEDRDQVLQCGNSKSYTNMYFYAQNVKEFISAPKIGVNMKDQDFAIYRELSLQINDVEQKVVLPVVAIEAKTYLDKTMLEGSIATAEKIKTGNPYSKFFIVTETYEVDLKVDPAYSRIDQIYVLRKSNTRSVFSPIDVDVVKKLVDDVSTHLNREWSNIEHKLTNEGVIL